MAPTYRLSFLALAAAALAAQAQTTTEVVTITGRSNAPSVSGFGTMPLASSPIQASVFGADELAAAGASSLADLTRLDAGIADAYNAVGYWSFLTVRGFVLDNRSNYRRDGLPINAETALTLANKERIEVLKGTSGIQAGTSAPGGLVNFVVKRPDQRVRGARLDVRQGGTVMAQVDLAERFGAEQRAGLRLNLAAADLDPRVRDASGRSHAFALAGDWQLTPDTRIEAEFEQSHQRQPSVPGFSLRGNVLPDPRTIDPLINLNNQPWSLPVVLDGQTASLRLRQRLSADWHFQAHGATQRLTSDDRIAFPFGCYDAVADVYWADRYCPDGSFDLYDFRSENERRRVDALDLQLLGVARTGAVTHEISTGVLFSRGRDRFQRQAFNYAGTGNDGGTAITPAAPALSPANPDLDERRTELYLRDAMRLSPRWSLWAGLRHTRLQYESDVTQSFTTPWLALAHHWTPATTVYLSWGQGVETDVAPNRSRYVNAGQPLPALKSRQLEGGVKHAHDGTEWSVVGFRIQRPLAADIGTCDVDASCERRIDGDVRHQGVEAALAHRAGAWRWQASAMWLDAARQGASDPALNGLRPTNVAARSLRAQLDHDLRALPGLRLSAAVVHEGPRMVLPDNSVESDAWTRLDLSARWATRIGGVATTWQIALDNVTDERAWRETPYQFGHAYLFPLTPRSWRASVQAAF